MIRSIRPERRRQGNALFFSLEATESKRFYKILDTVHQGLGNDASGPIVETVS